MVFYRPLWWCVSIGIFNITIPMLKAILMMSIPEQVLLWDNWTDDKMLRYTVIDLARDDATGYFAICFLSFLAIRAKTAAILRLCCQVSWLYFCILFTFVYLQLILWDGFYDWVTLFVDPFLLFLHSWMLYSLKDVSDETLVVTGSSTRGNNAGENQPLSI